MVHVKVTEDEKDMFEEVVGISGKSISYLFSEYVVLEYERIMGFDEAKERLKSGGRNAHKKFWRRTEGLKNVQVCIRLSEDEKMMLDTICKVRPSTISEEFSRCFEMCISRCLKGYYK